MTSSNVIRVQRLLFGVLLPAALLGAFLASGGSAERKAELELLPADCATLPPLAGGTTSVMVDPSAGVTQPLAAGTRLAACSLSIANLPYYTAAQLVISHWDPQALAPDPTTVALRTRTFTPSSLVYGRTRADFSPPIVTGALSHVAEAYDTPIAFDWKVTDLYNGQAVRYEAEASAGLPAALQYPPSGPRQALSGNAPALNLFLCDGGEPYEAMRVAQGVMRTDVAQSPTIYEWAQRFRVPETVSVGWVEFALAEVGYPPYQLLGRVAIFDGEGQSAPPFTFPASLTEAGFFHVGVFIPVWTSHYDMDRPAVLLPGRDYWLALRCDQFYRPYTRIRNGTESADFVAGIGPLFAREESASPWSEVANQALSFRLIGSPSASAGAGSLAASRGPLVLSVAPNPASGASLVSWSGAAGGVRVEVLDARGRRVARAESAAGFWNWSGSDAAGRTLPAGVYFVRATDSDHRTAVQRVVRVR
jgi:hypothetical protein